MQDQIMLVSGILIAIIALLCMLVYELRGRSKKKKLLDALKRDYGGNKAPRRKKPGSRHRTGKKGS